MDDRPTKRRSQPSARASRDYKAILQRVLERAPPARGSGSPTALGKNRSFVTQITNPAYDTPIPARHVDLIFEICHFSPAEREPSSPPTGAPIRAGRPAARQAAHARPCRLRCPTSAPTEGTAQLDALIGDFVEKLVELIARAARLACGAVGGDAHEEADQRPSTRS